MKSVFITFLMFIVVFSLLKLNILSILTGNYLLYLAAILFIAVIAAAIYFVGLPSFTSPTDKEDKPRNNGSKLKVIFAAFLVAGSIFVLLPHAVWAEESSNAHSCKKEALEKIEKILQEQTDEALAELKTALETYNANAAKFIKSCVPNLNLGTPWNLDKASSDIFTKSGISPVYLQYTGIVWDNVNAPARIAGCDALLTQTKGMFRDCEDKRTAAQNGIELARSPTRAKCTCDENGENPQCMALSDVEGQLYATEGACKPFSAYQQELASCPLCPVFRVILQTDAKIADVSWEATAKPLQKIVLIFFLVLLAIESLKGVSAMAGMRISSYLKSVLGIGLKVAIAYILLSQSTYIYHDFVSPVLKGGLNMGLAIANSSGANTSCMSGEEAVTADQKLDKSLLNDIYGTVHCFNSTASTTPAIARGLMCNSHQSFRFNFQMWLNGAVMYVFGLLIWLAITFYLIDCTVQLGILSALIPLLIACWPFKLTQNYSYKGVKMLMNTFFNYVMVGVVLLIGTMIMTYAATGNNGDVDMKGLIDALNNNDLKTLNKIASLDSLQLLLTISCAIFAMKLLASVNDLADQFSKGAGVDIGNKMGGMVSSAATSVGVAGAKVGGNVAVRGLGAISDQTGLTSAAQKGVAAIQRGHGAVWRSIGKNVLRLGKYQNNQTGSGIETPQEQPSNNSTGEKNNRTNNNNTGENTNKTNNNAGSTA